MATQEAMRELLRYLLSFGEGSGHEFARSMGTRTTIDVLLCLNVVIHIGQSFCRAVASGHSVPEKVSA